MATDLQVPHAHRDPTLFQAQAEANYVYGQDLRLPWYGPNPLQQL